MKKLFTLNKYFYKYKYHLIFGTIFVILSNLFGIYPAQIISLTFDLIEENISVYRLFSAFEIQNFLYELISSSLFLFAGLLLLMALIRGIFLFLMRQTIIVMSRRIENDIKNDIFNHYQKLHTSFYKMNNTGDLMARISEDVAKVRMYLGPGIMYSINLIVMFIIVIYAMFSVNVRLSLYVLLPLPFLSVSLYFINRYIAFRSEKIQKSLSQLSSFVQEAFSGIRILKSFAIEKFSISNLAQINNDYRQNSLQLARINALYFPVLHVLLGLSTILVIYIGGIQVLEGAVTTGNIAEFVIYVNMLAWPVASLGWVSSLIQRAAVSQGRILEFLTVEPQIVGGLMKPEILSGKVAFRDVSMTYKDTGVHALKSLSFELNAGKSMGIIGKTGSGKSSVASLLLRLYDPDQGIIQIDDQDLRNYDLYAYRAAIGYVPQDVFLFSDTLFNNIAFGIESATSSEVRLAANRAGILDFIMSLPDELETRIGERGINLSGGQKQRLAIARAILRKPQLMILDDCLSAVDTKTENKILTNLDGVIQNQTSIIISHRISSVKDLDRILVLVAGEVVEDGNHETLMDKRGHYFEMFSKQSSNS